MAPLDHNRPAGIPRVSAWERAILAFVLLTSLAMRLIGLDIFVTTDEPTWRERSLEFREALRTHDWAATYRTLHPGVVTMWLGAAAAEIVEHTEGPQAVVSVDTGVARLTVWARRLVAVVTWAGIVALYALLRRTISERAAILAAILVALDPFYLAHSRLHHLDALLTTFSMLAVASLVAYLRAGRRLRYLLLSAAMTGLAVVNKSSGLAIAMLEAVVIAVAVWEERRDRRSSRALARLGLLWVCVSVLTVFAVWPALWVAPVATIVHVAQEGADQALNPHINGNYFWFRPRDDPGPAFYPVAWVFRTTPWVLIGLAGLLARRRQQAKDALSPWALVALGYALLMTLSAKEFDRYLLPAFPAVDILAGVGWAAIVGWLGSRRPGALRWLAPAAPMLLAAQLAVVLPAAPYYLNYYDPLVGGTRAAPHVLLVGWGEGIERAAAYINAKPDAADLTVAVQTFYDYDPLFNVRRSAVTGELPIVEPDYFVLYIANVQRHLEPEVMDPLYGVTPPEYTVSVNGIDYAWVYPNTIYRREALGILDRAAATDPPETTSVAIAGRSALSRAYQGPLALYTLPGSREDVLRSGLQQAATGRRTLWLLQFPGIEVDAAARALAILDAEATRTDVLADGGVTATRYVLPPGHAFVPDPATECDYRLGDAIRLVGYDAPSIVPPRGEALRVRLYWEAMTTPQVDYQVFTHLLGPSGETEGQMDSTPQGGDRPTTTWTPGERIIDDYDLVVAEGAPSGAYTLEVGMYDLDTMQRLPVRDAQGAAVAGDRVLVEGLALSP